MKKTSEEDKKVFREELTLNLNKKNLIRFKNWLFTTEGKISVGTLVGLILITFLIMKACEPPRGSILYGICNAFLEQNISYPETIDHQNVEQYQKAVRIYYTSIGTFGEIRLDMIECAFMQHPQKGVQVDTIIFNHVRPITHLKPIPGKGRLYKVKQEVIDKFNDAASIPAIMNAEPDLTLPENKEDILENIYATE